MGRDSGFRGWGEKLFDQSGGALAQVICISPPVRQGGDSPRIATGETPPLRHGFLRLQAARLGW